VAIEIADQWRKNVKGIFPQLVEGLNFDFTSEVDPNYNCFGWALSYPDKYLENAKGSYWPWKQFSDSTVDGYAKVCELHGFTLALNAEFKPGFEKIAIFEDEEGLSHACRQDRIGRWKSKLGGWGPDIDHDTLQILEEGYGKVARVLERRRPDWE
jgi:hypothetical protein